MKRRAEWINRCVEVSLAISVLATFSLWSTAQADNILVEKQRKIIIDKSKFWDLELYYLTVNNKVFTANCIVVKRVGGLVKEGAWDYIIGQHCGKGRRKGGL